MFITTFWFEYYKELKIRRLLIKFQKVSSKQLKFKTKNNISHQSIIQGFLKTMSQDRLSIELPSQQFKERFNLISHYNDPFARQYLITSDSVSGNRAIYKHYLAETQQQLEAIYDNIQNYMKLSEQQGICRILAYTRLEQQQEILAAFQYNDCSLAQYIKTTQFQSNRPLFYVSLLQQLSAIIKTMSQIGIDIDQLNYGDILVSKESEDNGQVKIKVFYDQREKSYDKIIEGMKTFTSVDKLSALLTANDEYFNQLNETADPISPQNIYQLGMLLIDLMYLCETSPQQQADDFINRDRPVLRASTIALNQERSYYTFEDGIVKLNQQYINQKITFLTEHCSHLIKEITVLAQSMIAKTDERISLHELPGQIDRVFKIYRDSSKKVVRSVSTDSKKNHNEEQLKKSNELDKSQKNRQTTNVVSNIGSKNEDNIFDTFANKNTSSKSAKQSKSQKPKQSKNEEIFTLLDQINQINERSSKSSKQSLKRAQFKSETEWLHTKQLNEAHNEMLNGNITNGNSYSQGNSMFQGYEAASNFLSKKQPFQNLEPSEPKTQQPTMFQKEFITNSNTLSATKQTIGTKITSTFQDNYKSVPTVNSPQSQTSKHNPLEAVQKPIKQLIPKQSILMNLKTHQSIKSSLQNLIIQLELLSSLKKKQYYDNSVYYGEINPSSNKRSGLGLYIYPSGDVYFGTWHQNQLINGTYIFKNGQSYEGNVKNGKQGWGRYRYSNGNVYEGQWKDDIKDGKGTMWYPNQDKYDGEWKKGKKNGFGKYFYNNGTIYEGNFVNGRKQGFGTITFTNGTKIQANWQQTHIQGQGKVFYSNGDFYQGQYSMSQKHGKGLYVWSSDNSKYQGQFRKDTLEGEARIFFTQKQHYAGRIKNGRRDGQGRYVYDNGDEFEGEWKNDLKLIGHYRFRNGDQFEGKFKQNQLSFGVLRYSNGQIYEGEFKNGLRHGVGSYRNKNGELVCEGHWQNDDFQSSN